MSASENLILKIFNSAMSQLTSIDAKIDLLDHRIEKIDDRVTTLEAANDGAEGLRVELKNEIKEIKKLWATYRKYLILVAIFSLAVGLIALGFQQTLELLGKLFKVLS